MGVALGGGWSLTHVTDRVLHLVKEDYTYRRFTGRDGFVRFRAEPGMDRKQMIEGAVAFAQRQDAMLATLVAKRIVPGRQDYAMKQKTLAPVFATPEEPELIGVKRG